MKSLLCHSVGYFCHSATSLRHSARSRRIQYEGQMDSATTVRNDRGQKMDSAIPLRSTQNNDSGIVAIPSPCTQLQGLALDMDSTISLCSTQNDRRIIWNDEAVR